jgi:hypothetical protein
MSFKLGVLSFVTALPNQFLSPSFLSELACELPQLQNLSTIISKKYKELQI